MPETVEQFVKRWQTILAIILAAGFGYGMQSAEIKNLKQEIKVVRQIEQRLERIETNQERNYELLQEIRKERLP